MLELRSIVCSSTRRAHALLDRDQRESLAQPVGHYRPLCGRPRSLKGLAHARPRGVGAALTVDGYTRLDHTTPYNMHGTASNHVLVPTMHEYSQGMNACPSGLHVGSGRVVPGRDSRVPDYSLITLEIQQY